MDPNDDDLAYLTLLRSAVSAINTAPTSKNGIDLSLLPAVIREAFFEAHPNAACLVVDGKTYIRRDDWSRFRIGEVHQIMWRMRQRSLKLAVIGPTPDDLAQAPFMTHWMVFQAPGAEGLIIVGTPAGHPYCVGSLTRTSQLCGLAEDRSWARSASRWYRLSDAVDFEEMLARHGDKIAGAATAVLPITEVQAMLAQEQAPFAQSQ